MRSIKSNNILYSEFIRNVVNEVKPLNPVNLPVSEAIGHVVASEVRAIKDVPERTEAFMDGYAINAPVNSGANLKLRTIRGGSLGKGEAVLVRCGESIPEGANAVLPLEDAEAHGSYVKVLSPISPGYGIRVRGQEIRAGETLVRKGNIVMPELAKALIDSGIRMLEVYPHPKVVVIPTGDEFVKEGMWEITGHIIVKLIKLLGGEVEYQGPLPDEEADIAKAIETGIRSYDAIVVVGGTGLSWKDRSWSSRKMISEVKEAFRGIRIVPGRTTSMYYIRGRPVVILPGFLTAAYVSTLMVVAPIMFRLMGMTPKPALKPLRLARLINGSIRNSGREIRVFFMRSQGLRYVVPLKSSTHTYRVLLDSDSLAVLGSGGKIMEGDEVLLFSKYPSLI